MDIVDEVVAMLRAAPARLHGGRLLCIDGPAGSGKTTLAAAVASVLRDTSVLHMDDMYEGWNGLEGDTGERLRDEVMAPLAAGRSGSYRRFDWELGRFAEEHVAPPREVLVLEGVGAGDRALAAYRSLLVWVEAPDDVRVGRGMARDRALYSHEGLAWDEQDQRANWDAWLASERRYFAEHGVREAADLVVDGTRPPRR